jgi:1A family penicillin-binding protein
MPKPKPRRVTSVKRKAAVTSAHHNRLSRFITALRPANLKAFWFSHEGKVMAAKIAGGGFLVLLLLILFIAKDLPSPGKINAKVGAQTTRFYDRSGNTVLYEVHGDVNRTVIDFNAMPTSVKQATIAIEDKNFYHHGAFSSIGILRAAFVDLFHRGGGLQGGSTITQQYVKNALLTNQQSFIRKFKELILSVEIEQLYKKDDILKLYLNEIPYGTQAYGVQAAAKTYFGKDAKDLTLAESALLAAIPQAPSYYSPYGNHRDALIERQHVVLDQMVDQNYINSQQAEAAKQVDVLAEIPKVPRTYANVTAPYFVKYVESQLDEQLGNQLVDSGGLKVITTLDLEKQKQAEEAVAKNMANVNRLGGSNAALVAEDPKNGQVTAWVGGHDFSESQVDVASSLRQPGSSFKPFVYSTLFAKKGDSTWGPGSTLYDVKTDFGGGYTPKNYCNCNYGVVSIRQALGNSLNIPAVKALYLAGVSDSIQTAKNLGISTLNDSPDRYGLSLVLGSGEVKLADMVSGYSGFAAGGTHVDQVTVLKITDPKGKTVVDNSKTKTPKRVLDPQVVYELNSVLSDASARSLTFGSNFQPLIISGKTTAVKTGTTENYRDAWTIGYTQSTVAGIWTGNNDGHNMSGSSGAVAAPIWHDFMVQATKNEPNQPFTKPEGIKNVTLDAVTGREKSDGTKQTRSDIFASWYKAPAASKSQSAQVDKVSGKLATACTPPLAVQTVYSNAMQAEIPRDDPAFGRWNAPVQGLANQLGYTAGAGIPTEQDNVHNCSDAKPNIGSFTVTGNGPYTISANWSSGTFQVNKVEFYFDDQVISTQTPSGSGSYSFSFTAPESGAHNFKVVVTDAGLYQDEKSKSLSVNAGGTGFNNVSPGDGASRPHGVISFNWDNYPGATSYRLIVNGSANPPTATSSDVRNLAAGSYSWHADAYQGGTFLASTPSFSLVVN